MKASGTAAPSLGPYAPSVSPLRGLSPPPSSSRRWRSKIVRLRSSTAPQSAGEVALGAKRRVTEGAQGRASDAADNAIASGEETGLGKVEHAAQQALRVALAGRAVGEGVQ